MKKKTYNLIYMQLQKNHEKFDLFTKIPSGYYPKIQETQNPYTKKSKKKWE